LHQPWPEAPKPGGVINSAMQMDSSSSGGPVVNLLTLKQSAMWFFKTREGGMGLLQIIGFTENPRGVKIRYKLVQPSQAEIEKAFTAMDSAAAFQFRWVAAEGDTNSPADLLPDASGKALRVLKSVVLTERDVDSAGFTQYQSEQKELAVFLSPRGGDKFAEATAKNIGRQLAIVWHGRVIIAPVINAAITGRRVSINGRFNDAEAKQLLDLLNHRQTDAPKN
jgi:preprotein translocase subunit SecD